MRALILFIGLSLSTTVFASEDTWKFEHAEQQKLFTQLNQELRCPRCQNQSIGGSDAPVAKDMQRKTYQLIMQGKDRDEIVAFMKQRYGDFVHYQPPLTPLTLFLWIAPFCVVLIGGGILLKKNKPQSVASDDVEKARRLLEGEQ